MRMRLRGAVTRAGLIACSALLAGGLTACSQPSNGTQPGTTGTSGAVDTQKARERGAEIGEKAATAANKVSAEVADATLTGKIKAKMALDDLVRARAIDVSTERDVVTLSGTVRSAAERDRALALARETDGVARVVDHLQVAR